MFVKGKSRAIFFPSNTLIYGISRDGSKNFNMRTCEHMILGQLMMGASQTKNAPLSSSLEVVWMSPESCSLSFIFLPFLFSVSSSFCRSLSLIVHLSSYWFMWNSSGRLLILVYCLFFSVFFPFFILSFCILAFSLSVFSSSLEIVQMPSEAC